MKTNFLGLFVIVAMAVACNREPSGSGGADQTGSSQGGQVAPTRQTPDNSSDVAKPADNTGRNVRDRSEAAVTPGSQSETSTDVEVTRRVREALMHDKQLSTLAKNIKVVDTGNGRIVLRGPVNNDAEKQQIGQLAGQVNGVTSVDNQLEVKQNQ
jgi:osmotically-inducible protein OsmY